MLKQIATLLKPTRHKVIASASFTLVYIVAAFIRIMSAGLLLGPPGSRSSRILLMIVNWVILATLLYVTSSFIFSKNKSSEYSLDRKKILALVTILGLFLSHLFFEMPRFLASIFTSLASDVGAGSFSLVVIAELLLSYGLFSTLVYFMGGSRKGSDR